MVVQVLRFGRALSKSMRATCTGLSFFSTILSALRFGKRIPKYAALARLLISTREFNSAS
jgi:hypothetical protein